MPPLLRYVKTNTNRANIQLTVPLSSCGTQTVESSTDRLMIENTIVIQADPMVQDTWDSARKITCDWQSKLEKMVTFAPFGVADLLQVAEVKFAGSGDNVRTRMEIQFGRGPFAPPLEGLTKIGDELTVVVYAEDGGAGYDVLVKNCYAYDSRNFKRANKIRLLNDHGCLFRPHQMEYFRRTFDTRSTGADIIAFARMNAFKFPDKMDVYLSCELEMCKGGCDTHCEMEDYPIDIIDSLGFIRQPKQRQDTESIPITTFRPERETDKALKAVKRRRKPKKFSPHHVRDDAADVLSPPVTLSPEILELLEELGAQGGPQAQERSSESAFEGNSNSLGSTLDNVKHQLTAKMSTHPDASVGDTGDTSARGVPLSKMSFSTIFAGTHTTSDSVPPQLINNDALFQPSQLLSASIDSSAPFVDQITAQSHGSTGASPHFPQTAAHIAPQVGHANRLTNVLEQEHSLAGRFFKPAEGSGQNLGPHPVKFPPTTSTSFSPLPSGKAEARAAPNHNNNNKVATLQQQLQTEGQFICGPGSLDVKCNPKSHQINIGGFVPISTTPNAIVSSTVVFTSPRSVEKFTKQMSRNPNSAKEVLIKIVDQAAPAPPHSPPGRGDLRPGRARFGSRLANNAKRFANFFGAKRRRRDAVEWLPHPSDGRDVFSSGGSPLGSKETVNMVRGFQVVSAADLAFDPTSLRSSNHLLFERDQAEHQEEEICFPETAFYAGLLVACSLLMISGLVSVCSIRAVRRQRRRRVKARYFGGDTSLDSYN